MSKKIEKYLEILSKQYPTIRDASTEIINLQAILSLPKGTEHFLSDLHGEYEQFSHILKNGSGAVRGKIDEIFSNTLTDSAKRSLAALIYYPKEKLEIIKEQETNLDELYIITLHSLVRVLKSVSSKYTRSKVRKAIPKDFIYVVEELITEKEEVLDKEAYYNEIIQTIVRIGEAEVFIQTLCNLIQRLVIDHLHIRGDIYVRGPGPHLILDTLCDYHSVDVQWGNHDIVWMGAACGHLACIANVIRMSVKYGNLDALEDGYGINLMPLTAFSLKEYENVNCDIFKVINNNNYGEQGIESKIYKAISIIQFKLEGKIILGYPEFEMEDRLLLDKINYGDHTVIIDGIKYKMRDTEFPTVDQKNPYQLTIEEEQVMLRLKQGFESSEKLQKHVKFLFLKGGMYKVYNSNLLYHGCVPLEEDGSFSKMKLFGKEYSGKKLYDVLENYARKGRFSKKESEENIKGKDILWYLWNGPKSPLFGRNKISTFERIFVENQDSHIEVKNYYYEMLNNHTVINRIFKEFGMQTDKSHIINGHVPVEVRNGETPVKCDGKLLLIDGGFSKAYHKMTGIAGYTLVSNSRRIRMVEHEKFETTEKAVVEETDIISDTFTVEVFEKRRNVGDTDIGIELKENIHDLEALLQAYKDNSIAQKSKYF